MGTPPRRGGVFGHLATAALLVLLVVSAYVAVIAPHKLGPKLQQAGPPALAGTPEITLPPGVTEDTVLFRRTLDVIPAGATWAGVERVTIAPGVEWPQGTRTTTGIGPYLYRIEEGTMTARADGTIEVIPAGTTTANQIPAATEVTFHTDDQVFIPSGVSSRWRNDGVTSARVLDTGVAVPGGGSPTGVRYSSPIDAWPIEAPATPAELMVRRMTVEPGASLSIPRAAGLMLVGVETGTLTVDWMGGGTLEAPTSSQRVIEGIWVNLDAHQSFVRKLRNDEHTPLVFLLMKVTPVADGSPTP